MNPAFTKLVVGSRARIKWSGTENRCAVLYLVAMPTKQMVGQRQSVYVNMWERQQMTEERHVNSKHARKDKEINRYWCCWVFLGYRMYCAVSLSVGTDATYRGLKVQIRLAVNICIYNVLARITIIHLHIHNKKISKARGKPGFISNPLLPLHCPIYSV